MKFIKYDKMDGSWQEKSVAYLRLKGFDAKDIEWSVTEKVHGSNFSIWFDGIEFKYAKRSGFIKKGTNFYNHIRIVPSILPKIRKIWDSLEGISELVVYGELFGGTYPHPEVETVNNAKKIQKGLFYSPDNHFYAFDIMIDGQYVSVDEFEMLCKKVALLHAKTLFKGSFDQCLKYPNDFLTKIPELFNLPEITGNICEGVVLKTVKPMFYDDGGRLILKNKNRKWLEIQQKTPPKKQPNLSKEGQEILETINLYITENRLNNVLSKFGEFSKRDFGKVLNEFKNDVYEDYEKENGVIDRSKLDWKIIERTVGTLCADVFRPIFLRNI